MTLWGEEEIQVSKLSYETERVELNKLDKKQESQGHGKRNIDVTEETITQTTLKYC